MHESEKLKGSRSVRSDSSNLMDYSSPGSPVHGIFQARVLEWGAIAYFILLPFKHFYWHTVALQYCVSFYCTAKWTGLSHTYIPSFWISFGFISFGVLSRIPWAIQYVLISYLFYTWYQSCILVNPNLSIHPAPHPLYPLLYMYLFSTPVSLFLLCRYDHLYHFSRFHIYALVYNICFSLSD